jgi:hypothetical protein
LTSQDPIPISLLAYIRIIAPLVVLAVPLLFNSAPLRPVRHLLGRAFADIVPLESLIPQHPATPAQKQAARRNELALWRQVIFVGLGLLEAATWMTVVGQDALYLRDRSATPRDTVFAAGMVLIWVSGIC